MKQITKICPYCGKTFVTDQNARKFCRKKCAELTERKRIRKPNRYLCQWCGKIFTSQRRTKFCDASCQSEYMKKLITYKRTVVKFPVKITVEDAAKKAKEEKLTYGRYVSIHKI